MEEKHRSDVDDALDLFIGDNKGAAEKPKPSKIKRSAGKKASHSPTQERSTPDQPKPKERPRTTTLLGRPPGRKNGEAVLKAKTTIRIDAELIDEYRERVYVERRPLGELIEEAMREHKHRVWR